MNTEKQGAIKKVSLKKILLLIFLTSPAFYIAACEFISKSKMMEFESIEVGDTKEKVMDRFGTPSHVELPGNLYSAYASYQCKAPCVARLWFENKLSVGMEAWSLELDKDNRVINKVYWMSP